MRRPFRYAMSNPGTLLIAGNPGKTAKRKSSAKSAKRGKRNPYQTASQAQAETVRTVRAKVVTGRTVLKRRATANKVAPFIDAQQIREARNRAAERSAARANPRKNVMAKKSRKARKSTKAKARRNPGRSPAQRAATKRMLAANMTKRESRSLKRIRRAGKKAARRHAGTRKIRVHNVPASPNTVVIVRKVKRGAVRRARRYSGHPVRAFRVNPLGGIAGFITGPTGLVGSLMHAPGNVKSVAAGGVKQIALAAGAGLGAVLAGGFVKVQVVKMAMKLAPVWSAGRIGARVLTFGSYYATGWAIARFAVKDAKMKQAVMAGTVVAAALEVLRPGIVTGILAKLPVIGPMFGVQIAAKAAATDAKLAEYVDGALAEYVDGVDEYVDGYNLEGSRSLPTDLLDSDDSLDGYSLQGYNLEGDDEDGEEELDHLGCTMTA